jgi:phosphocarrier protein HPr
MGTRASGMSIRRTVIVANPPDGLHMRPATAFAKLARGFRCSVTVRHGQRVADGRSPTDLLMLIALPGSEVEVALEGDDADIAIDPLVAILTAGED